MRSSRHAAYQLTVLVAGMVMLAMATAPSGAAGAPKRPPSYGNATVTSVDGPGRLTLKTKGGPLKLRLHLIDTPEPGECGAPESTAALTRLTTGSRNRVRYVTWSRRPDAEGRLPALVGPRRADLTERSLGKDLVKREWARIAGVRTISASDDLYFRVATEDWGPRALRGVWARCGGHMHLPAAEPAPAHAPASWAINADGITESVGPIVLPTTLTPGTALTVADVERIARVEATDIGRGTCWARVPSLELVLWASSAAGTPCRSGEIFAVASAGPGVSTTTRGLQAGQPASAAATFFPRLAAAAPDAVPDKRQLPFTGSTPVPWAWQTLAGVDTRADKIVGFLTSTARWGD